MADYTVERPEARMSVASAFLLNVKGLLRMLETLSWLFITPA